DGDLHQARPDEGTGAVLVDGAHDRGLEPGEHRANVAGHDTAGVGNVVDQAGLAQDVFDGLRCGFLCSFLVSHSALGQVYRATTGRVGQDEASEDYDKIGLAGGFLSRSRASGPACGPQIAAPNDPEPAIMRARKRIAPGANSGSGPDLPA